MKRSNLDNFRVPTKENQSLKSQITPISLPKSPQILIQNNISPKVFDSLELSSVIKEESQNLRLKTEIFTITNEKVIPAKVDLPNINEIFEVDNLISELSIPMKEEKCRYMVEYTESGRIKYKGTWLNSKYHGWGCLYNRNLEKGEIDLKNLTQEAIGNK